MRYLKRVGKLENRDAAKVNYRASVKGDWKLWPDETSAKHKQATDFLELPVFYESRYFVDCYFLDEGVTEARVVHPMSSVADAFGFSHRTLVGSLDFVNSPGKFRLTIEYKVRGETKEVVLEWLVASEKMDVERDLELITKTIKEANPSLVHAFLAKTLTESGVSLNGGKQDENVWYALLLKVFSEYRQAVEIIVHRPHLKYVPHADYLRAERIKRWSPALANSFNEMEPAHREVALFRSERMDPEVDTVENRFVLFTLKALVRRLDDFATACAEHDSVSSEYVGKMKARRDELNNLAANPFFRSVGRFSGFKQESLALQRKPGYSRIYASWITLQQALDPNESGVDIGYRPISSLYEFWCFLTIRNKIAASHEFETPLKDFHPKFGDLEDLGGLFDDPDEKAEPMQLNKLVYEFAEVGGGFRKVLLTYQQSYGVLAESGTMAYLNPQRPDIVLTVIDTSKPEGEGVYSYIFDAKYRIRPSKSEDAPDETTSEAINAMHQYRDAILYRRQKGDRNLSREIIGAYVLYPGRPEPGSKDYGEVIASENIGAIPLLPSERNPDGSYVVDSSGHHGEEKLDSFLRDILKLTTPEQHLGMDAQGHPRVLPTRGTIVVPSSSEGAYLRDGLVYGTYRGQKQLAWIDKNKLYNLPLETATLLGIVNADDARRKRMLVLVPPPKRTKLPLKIFKIVGLAEDGEVEKTVLQSTYGYPLEPRAENYWLWKLETEGERDSLAWRDRPTRG